MSPGPARGGATGLRERLRALGVPSQADADDPPPVEPVAPEDDPDPRPQSGSASEDPGRSLAPPARTDGTQPAEPDETEVSGACGARPERGVQTVRDRLARLGASRWVEEVAAGPPLEQADGAVVVGSGEESFIRIDRVLGHEHGEALRAWLDLWHGDRIRVLTKDDRVAALDPRQALFFDTETTGLGGAGCFVFLVGMLHFRDGVPMLTQLLMPRPAAERAMLATFTEFVSSFHFLVSYNGRAFDVKALRDRYVLSRMRDPDLEEFPHLDLLHPSRRIWQLSLPDCRLATIERDILGRRRERDIEGWQIPSVYYRFLRTGQTAQMHDVLAHNVEDLLSLHLLGSRILGMVSRPDDPGRAEDGLGLGTLLTTRGDAEGGKAALRQGLDSRSPVNRYLARKRLASAHKRDGDFTAAVPLWRQMIDENVLHEVHPYDELAKFHEHRGHDLEAALAMVEAALERLPRTPARASLEHRRGRLLRKLQILQD